MNEFVTNSEINQFNKDGAIFLKGKFDVNITKSKVGFLSNFIIKNEKFERSFHPMFSFVAIGRNRKLLKKLGKSAFGKNSLHSTLLNKNCCFLNFNRTLIKGNTLMHHIEQKNKAKYRFEKVFKTKVYKNKIFNLYCYRVAGTVGLLCLNIFGENNKNSRSFGIALANAFQITNILRDIKEDSLIGRLYIPKEILKKTGIKENNIDQIIKNKKFLIFE